MQAQRFERKLAAILAADMVGFSRLMEVDEESTFARHNLYHQDLFDPVISEFGGRIIKTTGDGLLAEFASVVGAVRAAVKIQDSIDRREADQPEGKIIRYRIGINLGDIIVDGDDVFGDGVNIAARLEGIATPGGICLSEDAFRQIRGRVDTEFVDGGLQKLKNLSDPVRVFYASGAGNAATISRPLMAGGLGKNRYLGFSAGALVIALAAASSFLFFTSPGSQNAKTDAAGTIPQTSEDTPIIAVLPFADRSQNPGEAYFVDGVTEELINSIGRFSTLRVLSRNSTFQFKSGNVQPAILKSDFGANYMVEGSVRQQKDQIRISARIIDTGSGILLWSENYDGPMTDIFDIQDRIARKIAGSVATNVLSEEENRRSAIPVPDMSAFDLVLRARAVGYSSNCKSNREYRQLVEKSIKLDPEYALPHAMMSEALSSQVVLGCTEFRADVQKEAEQEARRSIALAPNEPDGYRALGRFLEIRAHREKANVDQARPVLARALQLNPSDASALALWGTLELFNGNFTKSVSSYENAKQLDSKMEPLYLFEFALAYYMSEQHEKALRLAEQSISNYPNFYLLRTVAGASAARLGMMEVAKQHIAAIRPILPLLDYQGVADGFANPDYAEYWLEGLKMAGV